MIQKTYIIRTLEELETLFKEVSESRDYKAAKSGLMQVYYASREVREKWQLERLVSMKEKYLGDMPILGSTLFTMGSPYKDFSHYYAISILLFDESTVEVVEYDFNKLSMQEAGLELGQKLQQMSDVKCVEICGSAMENTINLYEFLGAAHQGNEDIPFFGQNAGHDFDYYNPVDFHPSVIFGSKEIIREGAIAAIFSGENLQVDIQYNLGWKEIGRRMLITKCTDWNCIAEIDGEPATNIYEKYLALTPEETQIFNTCEFPLLVKRKDRLVARIPIEALPGGRLLFNAGVIEGEKLAIGVATPEDLIKSTQAKAEASKEFEPEAMILILCGVRSMFLKGDTEKEIEYFQQVCGQLIWIYGDNEILLDKVGGSVLTTAVVAAAFREGTKEQARARRKIYEENAKLEDASIKPALPEFKHLNAAEEGGEIPVVVRLGRFLEAITSELVDAVKAANQANEAKSAFLSNMSHEIRTPINAIIGMNEMIIRESKDEEILKYARDVKSASVSLLGIVNDVLDFSKIEAGKMKIVPVEYELASVLNDLVNMVRKRAEDKGLSVSVYVDPSIPHVLYGDEIRIKQIITNILTNAVKYTEEGQVELSVRWKACGIGELQKLDDSVLELLEHDSRGSCNENITLEISVKDTGIGIKEEDLPKLFDTFERIEEKRNRTIEGAGLGMNITQMLLNLMGSQLQVESVYGQGSTFSFDIIQKVVDDRPIGNFENALRKYIATEKKYHQSFVAPEASILVVDDTEINLTVFKNLLKQTKVQIDTATSGFECLRMTSLRKYDIIFLDHRMPEMDGIQCLQHLKENESGLNFNTPVIALTANAVSGSREMYLDAGFDDYMTKPISTGVLEGLIQEHLPKEMVKKVESTVDKSEENSLPEWIKELPFVDAEQGMENCGGNASYQEALKAYLDSVQDMQQAIRDAWEEGRLADYTLKVHALKSSSKIIGAAEIGRLAEQLEEAENTGDLDTINGLTEELLSFHRSLGFMLKRHMHSEEDDSDKHEIPPEKLSEAFTAIKEIAQMFDYDSLTVIMESLDEYAIPKAEQKRVDALKKAVNNADWDTINKLMEG